MNQVKNCDILVGPDPVIEMWDQKRLLAYISIIDDKVPDSQRFNRFDPFIFRDVTNAKIAESLLIHQVKGYVDRSVGNAVNQVVPLDSQTPPVGRYGLKGFKIGSAVS